MNSALLVENCFWMFRYWVRAEYIAKSVYYYDLMLMDHSDVMANTSAWLPIFETPHLPEPLETDTLKNAVLWDSRHTGSLLQTLAKARNNAKMARSILHPDLWETINTAYFTLNEIDADFTKNKRIDFFQPFFNQHRLIEGCLAHQVPHTGYYHVMQLGATLERAYQLARVITALSNDTALLCYVLRLFNAEEAFLQQRHTIHSNTVMDFMLTDAFFPHSMTYLLKQLQAHLAAIAEILPNAKIATIAPPIENLLQTNMVDLLNALNQTIHTEILFQNLFYYGDMHESNCRPFL